MQRNANLRILTLMHWNANGVLKHAQELEHELQALGVHVYLISETHLTAKKLLKLKEYSVYRTDRPNE